MRRRRRSTQDDRLKAGAESGPTKRGRAAGETDDLLEAHRATAELLGVAQKEVAEKLRLTKTNAGVDALMAGQREAVAILLEALMRVTEGRPPAERLD